MPKQRPTTVRERKAKNPATLPTRFRPRFLADADHRQTVVKLIKRRVEQIKDETGADSLLKELLIEEAVFLSVMLATGRMDALEGLPWEPGSHVQTVNAFSGLATKLGLDAKHIIGDDLKTYLANKGTKS